MNKFFAKAAKREGFTLVELIVVIAILGILAGIAVPVYSGYIKKANEAADLQQLDSLKTAAIFAYTEAKSPEAVDVGYIAYTVEDKTVSTVSAGTSEGTAEVVTDAVKTLMGGSFPEMKSESYQKGASWTSEAAKWVPADAEGE